MRLLLLGAVAGVAAACHPRTIEPAPPAIAAAPADAGVAADAAPIPPALPRVIVTEQVADDAWDVTWEVDPPADALAFDRRRPSDRHARWVPGPGLRWTLEDDHEVLRPIDGARRTTFSVRFATDDADRGRAPPLNVRFSDGGRLLFTAQLGAHALGCDRGRCRRRDDGVARRWEFHTAPGRGLRVLDAAAPGALTWIEPAGDLRGTYLYAGDLAPVDAAGAALIVDPGLPAWLARETAAQLPALLARHAERTGLALEVRPLVFVSHGDPRGAGDGLRGRALPGLIQLEATGAAWTRRTAIRRMRWFELIAHESFHLWNGQLARRSGELRDEWMSEGSAVYVSTLALRDAGLIDDRGVRRRTLESARHCRAHLAGPLASEAAQPTFYSCGELVHFLVDGRTGGLFELLTALYRGAQARGSYATTDLLALVDARADATFAADLRALVERGPAGGALDRLLAGAGLTIR